MKTLYTVLFLFSFSLIYAQQRDTGPQSSAFSNNLETFGIQLAEKVYNNNTLDEIEGNYHLFNDWTNLSVKVKLNNTLRTFNLNCNYNLASTDLEIKLSDNSTYVLNKSVLIELTTKNEKYTFFPINGKSKLVRIIGSKQDKYYYIEDYSVEIQTVQTTTLGLFKNKFVKKTNKYLVTNNDELVNYNRKSLRKIANGKNINKKNSIQKNLEILNSI